MAIRTFSADVLAVVGGVAIALACGGCSSADTSTSPGLARLGGYSGSGAPNLPSSNAPSGSSSNSGGGSPQEGSTPSPVVHDDAGSTAPVASDDAGAVTTTPSPIIGGSDAGATTTSVGGCANGCADGCLTLAINFCKTSAATAEEFCQQVPASCACNTAGGTPPAPSLTQCIADIENQANNAGDDTGN